MNLDKIKTYIGFAKKSKSIVFGLDSIKDKKVELIMFSESLSESSKLSCVKEAEKNKCNYYEISAEEMYVLIGLDKVKAFAIINKDLAKAIINNI